MIKYVVFAVYNLALIYITIHCLMQLQLLYFYRKNKKKKEPELLKFGKDGKFPFVTIQLPIYNEMYVVDRLLDSIAKLDYPKDRFEIHVLDDSTDETKAISLRKVEEYKAKGFNIEQILRADRKGYKAGALKEAMAQAKGEFIAIFDADFLPKPDFLMKTMGYFENKKIGVVQTRWEHINKDYSILTRCQAMQLDVHFTVEQKGREAGNCLLQFNGTAGVWRRQTIEEAGGWEADTLTEDLDLSYRAQLKGWEIVFREEIGSPAELPAEMNSLRSQQFRWQKGGAETAKKMLPTIWRSDLVLRQKMHATSHLMGSTVFIFMLVAALASVPLNFMMDDLPIDFSYSIVFFSAIVSLTMVYFVANVQSFHDQPGLVKRILKFIVIFPIFLALSMGLSFHNTIAVLQGWWGKKTAFIRTPKFNIKGIKDKINQNNYITSKLDWIILMEGLLAVYFFGSMAYGIYTGEADFMFFHLMVGLGFAGIFYYSLKHLKFK